MARQIGAAKKGVTHGDSSCAPPGSSQLCSFPPPTAMPSPAHQGFPPSTAPSSSSSMLGRNSQFQPRPKPSVLARMSQPCPVLPSSMALWKYPACFLMEVTRSFSLQVQGRPVLCSAMQGRGWLWVGAGTDLLLPKAAPPGRGQGKGKQKKSRDDLTHMQKDEEKRIHWQWISRSQHTPQLLLRIPRAALGAQL